MIYEATHKKSTMNFKKWLCSLLFLPFLGEGEFIYSLVTIMEWQNFTFKNSINGIVPKSPNI